MARKQAADLRAAAHALAPVAPKTQEQHQPAMTEEEKRASRERIERLLHGMRERLKAKPKAHPIEHWRKILSSPYACFIAKKMAQEAIDKIEGTVSEAERIAMDAEMQETARRIAAAQASENAKQEKLSTENIAK